MLTLENESVDGRTGSTHTADIQNLRTFDGNTYECRVVLCPEKDGGFSAIATRLPGVASQGESIEEALAMISDAFAETISEYITSGAAIPWEDCPIDQTDDCIEMWILVDV